jgi:hypothetical protein
MVWLSCLVVPVLEAERLLERVTPNYRGAAVASAGIIELSFSKSGFSL